MKDNWKDEVDERAKHFSVVLQNQFNEGLKECRKLVPPLAKDDDERFANMVYPLNTYVDVMIGTSVFLACRYINDSVEHENEYVEHVRKRFRMLRTARSQGLDI